MPVPLPVVHFLVSRAVFGVYGMAAFSTDWAEFTWLLVTIQLRRMQVFFLTLKKTFDYDFGAP